MALDNNTGRNRTMAFGKKAVQEGPISIAAPNFATIAIGIVGTAPYVCNNMGKSPEDIIPKKGPDAPNKKDRPAKDFDADFLASMHVDVKNNWVGIPAAAIRAALVRSAILSKQEMTKIKQVVFVEADGEDKDGRGLVRITKGKPQKFVCLVKNANGSTDARSRAKFPTGWEATVRITYDADVLRPEAVGNLLMRAGVSVGIGAGRPFSSNGAGCGWGTFTIRTK